jgi:hypothetical protein
MSKIIHKESLVGNQTANSRKSAASQDLALDVKACPRRILTVIHRRTSTPAEDRGQHVRAPVFEIRHSKGRKYLSRGFYPLDNPLGGPKKLFREGCRAWFRGGRPGGKGFNTIIIPEKIRPR